MMDDRGDGSKCHLLPKVTFRTVPSVILAIVISAIVVVVVTSTLCKQLLLNKNHQVVIVEEESYFSSFEIKENKVYIKCNLCIINKTDSDRLISVEGVFREDAEGGLLVSELLSGTFTENGSNEIQISSHQKKSDLEVTFVGEKGPNSHKHDRMLPEINILIK